MPTRLLLAAAALLLTACATPNQPNPIAAMEADAMCRTHTSAFQQRSSIGLHDECTRRMGEAYCRRCLVQ